MPRVWKDMGEWMDEVERIREESRRERPPEEADRVELRRQLEVLRSFAVGANYGLAVYWLDKHLKQLGTSSD